MQASGLSYTTLSFMSLFTTLSHSMLVRLIATKLRRADKDLTGRQRRPLKSRAEKSAHVGAENELKAIAVDLAA
jgi:hypothetical protein